MSRIRRGYEDRFRVCLRQLGARRLERGVQWLVAKAERLSLDQRMQLADALARIAKELAARSKPRGGGAPPDSGRFFCDAGLGGLARWLRAAGYEAEWEPHIPDDDLLREAQRLHAIIVTTDAMLMERRLLRDRVLPAFWLPPTLSIAEQLTLVFREFNLAVRSPRCMSCGGELRRGDKEALQARIPPCTFRWLDEYFVCCRCDRLFWHGTHWQRIRRTLEALRPKQPEAGSVGS